MYIVMGWLVTLALGPTLRGLTGREVGWLAAGGAIYTLGAVVYATKRPDLWRGRFESHDLWHSMVLAAAGCHYLTVQSLVSAT
jgi:hemolysin III